MKGTKWESFLAKDSHTDEEWLEAHRSSANWCSCAIGVLVLKDDAVEDPLSLNELEREQKNQDIEMGLNYDKKRLGLGFDHAIMDRDLKKAKRFWNYIMEIKNK